MTGIVFSIERYAIEDGPGIRTLIFLKGCPLKCVWCANPESHEYTPEILYFSNKCASCGRCIEICPQDAIFSDDEFGLVTDPNRCTLCGDCVDACYYGAREISGKEMEIQDVIDIIERDKMFYDFTGGGVTVSGGEPLLQTRFVRDLTSKCKELGIHTAIETTLFADTDNVIRALEYVDLVFVDIKHIDPDVHKRYTGVRNDRILQNLQIIDDLGKSFIVRIPYIPGFNDDDKTQKEIYHWVSRLKNMKWVEILPYHRLGIAKYKSLARPYAMAEIKPVSKESISYLECFGAEFGVEVRIGAR